MRLFIERCAAKGYKPIECGGNGHCLLFSLAHEMLVNGLGVFAVAQLRAKVASWLEAHPMEGFICTDEFSSWAEFCDKVRDEKFHTLGGEHILVAISAIFNVQIRVSSITKAHDKVYHPGNTEDGRFVAILHLGHIPEQHYVAMTPVLNHHLYTVTIVKKFTTLKSDFFHTYLERI